MTGTSLDGLDVALVRLVGHGLNMTAQLIQWASHPLGTLAGDLQELAKGMPFPAADHARVARCLGQIHVEAIAKLQYLDKVDFIVAHGQTIWHGPDESLSVQLLDPWPMVRELGLPVCHDLRQADLIAGGQGAPITPLADWILFRANHPRQIVNLGGICNVTYLPAEKEPHAIGHIQGQDVGPCNLMIDAVVKKRFALPFDEGGQLAALGQVHPEVYDLVCQAAFFKRPMPRTTGREDFNAAWVEQLLKPLGLNPHDAAASVVDSVARLIADGIEQTDGLEVVLAGGGALNETLVTAIKKYVTCNVSLCDEVSNQEVTLEKSCKQTCARGRVGVQAREAVAMAVLGGLCQDGVPITLEQITGATNPGVAGCWVGGPKHDK